LQITQSVFPFECFAARHLRLFNKVRMDSIFSRAKQEWFKKFLDSNGSFTLTLKLSAYFKVDGGLKTIVTKREAPSTSKVFEWEKKLSGKVSSLLGNKDTCDVTISVVNEGKEIGSVPSHSFILLGNSQVNKSMPKIVMVKIVNPHFNLTPLIVLFSSKFGFPRYVWEQNLFRE